MTQSKSYNGKYFKLELLSQEKLADGTAKLKIHSEDTYSRRRYALERRAVAIFSGSLNRYLRKRPHIKHDSRRNLARSLVYLSPAVKAWAQYMPGGFATYHVHNPKRLHLLSGKKIDYIAKILFRHSVDGQGLRSRAYAMTWFIKNKTAKHDKLNWLSVACGTGQPTFDAASEIGGNVNFYFVDDDARALEFAEDLSVEYGISKNKIEFKKINAISGIDKLDTYAQSVQPNVIDAMGIFEYLQPDDAVNLLKVLYDRLDKDGVLVFTNMLPDHPHLHLHQRGLGWPGVIQRETKTMRALIKKAGIPLEKLSVILPDDQVYAVYGVVK